MNSSCRMGAMKRKQAGEEPEAEKCGEGHISDTVRFILMGTQALIYKANLKNVPATQVTGKMHIVIQLSKNCFTTVLPSSVLCNDHAHPQYILAFCSVLDHLKTCLSRPG